MKPCFVISTLILATLLATSCWRVDEDWSVCEVPGGGLELCFHIDGMPDARFGDHIRSVEVWLYDADLNALQTRTLSRAMLAESLKTTFEVDPGTYHVVCWANVGDNTRVPTRVGNLSEHNLSLASPETGDPLWYAPKTTPRPQTSHPEQPDLSHYRAEVTAGKTTVKDMTFVKAHRTVEVFVSGWEYLRLGGVPTVERSGAGGWYDYLLRYNTATTFGLRRTTSLITVDGVNYLSTKFHSALIPIAEETGPVWLTDSATGKHVSDPDTQVDLRQWVATHKITDDSYIPIHYKFTGGGDSGEGGVSVNMELPPWSNHNVTPGF